MPVATLFDDHDVHDDWNTSQAWVDELRKKPCRAGVPDPPLDWAVTDGPLFDNQVGIVEIAGRTARVGVERTTGADWRRPALTTSLDRRLV